MIANPNFYVQLLLDSQVEKNALKLKAFSKADILTCQTQVQLIIFLIYELHCCTCWNETIVNISSTGVFSAMVSQNDSCENIYEID